MSVNFTVNCFKFSKGKQLFEVNSLIAGMSTEG